MLKLNGFVNCGFCQGTVCGPIIEIDKSIIAIDLNVQDTRVNPRTQKKRYYRLRFIARDELANRFKKEYQVGDLVLLNYHLSTRFRFNKNIGIGRFENQFDVMDYCIKKRRENERTAYLNKGLYQCTFLGIAPQINAEGIHVVDTVLDVEEGSKRTHISFIVFGGYCEYIKENFTAGQKVTIEYKLERTTSTRPDGDIESFTNCIVEKIV